MHDLSLMLKRTAAQLLALFGSLFFVMYLPAMAVEQPGEKMIAVTIDDLPLNGPSIELAQLRAMTQRLVTKLQANHVPAIGFVNEKLLFEQNEVDARIALLETWLDHGLELGNHAYSHMNLSGNSVADFEADVIRGETFTSMLLDKHKQKLTYFRYPYLATGENLEKKTAIETFLHNRAYVNAPVTADAQDWWFTDVYTKAMQHHDKALMKRIASEYLNYTGTMLSYNEKYSVDLFGYPIRQTFLLHCSPLNADYMDEVIKVIRDKGYTFVPLSKALEDPAYKSPDTYVGTDGITWLQRWKFSKTGINDADKIPEPPKFVADLHKDPRYAD